MEKKWPKNLFSHLVGFLPIKMPFFLLRALILHQIYYKLSALKLDLVNGLTLQVVRVLSLRGRGRFLNQLTSLCAACSSILLAALLAARLLLSFILVWVNMPTVVRVTNAYAPQIHTTSPSHLQQNQRLRGSVFKF